jgi:hypothetical protein
MALGLASLGSSRDATAFACGAARLAGGARLQLILNSLSLDFIAASFASVAESGALQELGKRGIWSGRRQQVSAPHSSFCAVALDADMEGDAGWMHHVLVLLSSRVSASALESLPLRSFALETQHLLAFRTLQSGLNLGKVVLRVHGRMPNWYSPLRLSLNLSHVLTGGTSGLGLLTARWLWHRGARGLVLASRGGRLPVGVALEWAAASHDVRAVRCDTAEPADARRLFADPPAGPPRGLWHAAGVVSDALFQRLDAHTLRRVYASKANGARALAAAISAAPVRACVLFSSITALFGFAGQANYAAANACLDALSMRRRSRGGASVSVQWGAWAEVGMAAAGIASTRMAAMEASTGLGRIQPELGLAALGTAIRAIGPSVLAVVPINWTRLLRATPASPFLSAFATEASTPTERAAPTDGAASAAGPVSLGEVLQLVQRTAGGSVDADAPLMEAGVDSLGAVELRNQLQRVAGEGVALPTTVVFDHPTARQLATMLAPAAVKESVVIGTPSPATARAAALVRVSRPSAVLPEGVSSHIDLSTMVSCSCDGIGEVPTARWALSRLDSLPDTVSSRVRNGGFVRGIELLDHLAFGLSTAEASATDPQQRVLLETAYSTFHTAGLPRTALGGSDTGVFVGIAATEFGQLLERSPVGTSVFAATGSSLSIASGRISYVLGLHGPCASYAENRSNRDLAEMEPR